MVALTEIQQAQTKFHLQYNLATPAIDLARLQRAMTQLSNEWTSSRIADLIERCETAYVFLQLDASDLVLDQEVSVTGHTVSTTTTKNRDPYNRRQRYYLETTNLLANGLGVRNFRDPEQVHSAYLVDGGLYLNSLPGIQGEPGAPGPIGPTGRPGAGIDWRGAWNNVTDYLVNDGVQYLGSAWIANTENTNKEPGVDPDWDLLVSKGDPGSGVSSFSDLTDVDLTGLVVRQTIFWNGTIWIPATRREVLTANRTYFVRTDGNDLNTGLANTAGGAFLTGQKLIDVAAEIDTNGYNITGQFANGTYARNILSKPLTGGGKLIFRGNPTNSNAVIFTATTGRTVWIQDQNYEIESLRIDNSGSFGLQNSGNASTILRNLRFGACGLNQIFCNGGEITFQSGLTIQGGAQRFIVAAAPCFVYFHAITVTLTGSPAYSSSFAFAENNGFIWFDGTVFSGSATGQRFNVTAGGIIRTTNVAPGSIAGVAMLPGAYFGP